MTEKSNIKILLIDDDKFLLDMYSLKFKKAGLEIDTSSTSTGALEKIRDNSEYNILLLDIIMPGMDGIELLGKIRQEKLAPKAAVIMLTNQADDVEKARALGVDGYIIKATTIPSEVVDQVLTIYKNK
jgi:two-component system, OmpR family, alkaline phosphatase synthesis response regulator PhoP